MANILEQFKARRAVSQENKEYHDALEALSFSRGISEDLRAWADINPDNRVGNYIHIMGDIEKRLQNVDGKAEEVFFGTQTDDLRVLENTFEYNHEMGPEHPSYAEIYRSLASNTACKNVMIRHLVELTAHVLHEPVAHHEVLVEEAIHSLKDSYGWRADVVIGEWNLRVSTQDQKNRWLEVYMEPVELPHYRENWQAMHKAEIHELTRLDNVTEAMNEATSHSYRMNIARVGTRGEVFHLIDVGSIDDVRRTLWEAGWEQLEGIRRPSAPKELYRHKDAKPEDPLLGMEYLDHGRPRASYVYFEAVTTPEYVEKVQQEFYGQFNEASKDVLAHILSKAMTSETPTDLSPSRVIWETLRKLNQTVESYYSAEEMRVLGRIVVKYLVHELIAYPALNGTVTKLRDSLRIAESQDRYATNPIDFGWHPESIKITVDKGELDNIRTRLHIAPSL